jgi:hypothetical protein
LDAGLAVVAMRDDRSIGNLRVEARNPRERIQERNPAVLRSRTEASLRLIVEEAMGTIQILVGFSFDTTSSGVFV